MQYRSKAKAPVLGINYLARTWGQVKLDILSNDMGTVFIERNPYEASHTRKRNTRCVIIPLWNAPRSNEIYQPGTRGEGKGGVSNQLQGPGKSSVRVHGPVRGETSLPVMTVSAGALHNSMPLLFPLIIQASKRASEREAKFVHLNA